MGIFLSLTYSELFHARAAYNLPKKIMKLLLLKCHPCIHASIKLSHGNKENIQGPALPTGKIFIYHGPSKLSCPVCTEIKEYKAVPCLNAQVPLCSPWDNKLIHLICCMTPLYQFQGV